MKFTLSIFIYVFGLMLFLNFLHAHSISIGDNVSMVADNVKVRTCPLLSCSDNGRVSIYTVGIVEDGPRDEDGYYWWKVDWEDNSPDGWTPTPKNDYSWYYEKPTGLSPGGSSSNPPVIDDAAPQLSWNKVDGVHHYTVTIIEKSSGDVTYHDNINGSSTSYTLPSSLEEGKRYLWSVLPYDDDDDMGLKADYIYFDVKSQAESSYDLRIRPEDITIHSQSGDDDTINVGEMFDIRVNVHNVGDANSDSYRVKYYYKGASSGDFGSYFDTDSDSGTDAGDSDSETSNDKEVDGGSGTHWVKVCVYDNNDDSDHNNDCGIQSFPVQGNSNPDPDPNILTISTIDPNPIISSTSKQNIMISGSNFTSASRIMWKTSSGNNGIVSDEGTFFVDSSNIRVYIRVTSTSSTWSFKVVNDDGSESEWKSVPNQKDNTPSRPVLIHDEDAVKGGRSGEAIPFDFIAYDLDDLANGEIYYTLVVNWGDGSAVSSTQVEYSEEPVTLTHAYNTNQTGTYTAVAYAVDSSGTKSSDVYIPVKIQGSDPASVPIENTMYNRKEIANATGEICRSEGRSIDKATGAENFSITPLKVKGLFDLPFTLQYNSVLLSGEQYISKGWSHNYHFSSKITEIENGNYRVYWDNSAKKYNDFKYDLSKQHYVSDEKAVLDDVLKIDNDGRLKLIRKNGAIYQYSNLGYLSSISNYKNQKIEITFDDDGRLRKVEEPVSSVFLTYSYNNDGKLASVKDGLGRITYLKYNSDGLLKEIEAPDSAIRYKFQYNNQEQLYKYIFVDTDGSETLYFDITYDTNGRASEEDDSKGNTSWFYFNTTNEADKIHSTYTDNVGRSTKTVYDDTNFNVYQIEHPDGTKEYLEYYANGKKKSWKNRAGKDTKYYYDDNGNLNKVIYSDGSEEQYTYDNNRNITFKKIIDKNANQYITHNIYDEYNNLTKTELPNGDYTTYTYNDNNQMVTKTINNKQ